MEPTSAVAPPARPVVAFSYPRPYADDAVGDFIALLSRHCRRHVIMRCRRTADVAGENVDALVLLTSCDHHSRATLDEDIRLARQMGLPFTVLHHNDHGQPSPGDYPSAVWTETGRRRLEKDYRARLVRLPVFPPLCPPHAGPPLVGTVGLVEPKKRTLEMHRRCREIGVPFAAFGPRLWANQYRDYIASLKADGCDVRLWDWFARMEEAEFLARCSHFLFDLPGSKVLPHGGGSMTPRHVTLFGRPVVVVDDEDTYSQDGFTVLPSLSALTPEVLAAARPPLLAWGPDEFVAALLG